MNNAESDRTALQRLFDSFAEAALDDPELAREILTDAGMDAERLSEDGAALARRLYGASRLRAASGARSATEQRLSDLRERATALVREFGGDARAALARLLAGGDEVQLEVYFRKLSDISEEDAVDMLTEAELLRVLEEAEEEEGGEAEDGDEL